MHTFDVIKDWRAAGFHSIRHLKIHLKKIMFDKLF